MPDPSDTESLYGTPANRASSHASFWDERYAPRRELFGARPNVFIEEATRGLPPGSRVLDIAAGEGRNSVHLAREGHQVTMLDFSPVVVERLHEKAAAMDVDVEVVQADILKWAPEKPFDLIIASFLQLLPEERPVLWRRVQEALDPGGCFVGLFFRPEQITEGYSSGGPPTIDRMITTQELGRHFPDEGIRCLDATEMILREGILTGPAAVIQFIYKRA